MLCPHCVHPDFIRFAAVGVSNATVAKPADGSFKHYDEAKIQPSRNRLVQAAQALPASPPQTEVCSFIEIDELYRFVAKKNLNVGSG